MNRSEHSMLIDESQRQRFEEPQPPKDFQLSIDDMFEGVVMRMLAKRPEDRFQEPADMVQELERIAKFQNLEV